MKSVEERQLEIAQKIAEQRSCKGISCRGAAGLFEGTICPFDAGCPGGTGHARKAEEYIATRKKIQ